jgi:hypothetical protein
MVDRPRVGSFEGLVKEVVVTFRTRCLISLVALALFDAIIPIPILGVVLIYVVLQKPLWFREMVVQLYEA